MGKYAGVTDTDAAKRISIHAMRYGILERNHRESGLFGESG